MDVTPPKPAARLLIVDDDADIREMLRDTLSPEFDVELAADAESGLLAAGRIRPDLILVDLRMPGMDGFGFCLELRSRLELSHIADTLVIQRGGVAKLPAGSSLRATGGGATVSAPPPCCRKNKNQTKTNAPGLHTKRSRLTEREGFDSSIS